MATFRYSLQVLQLAFCSCLTFGEQQGWNAIYNTHSE